MTIYVNGKGGAVRPEKGFVVPNRDTLRAQAASVAAKAKRREILARLHARELSLAELRTMIDDRHLGRLRVKKVIGAIRGPKSASRLLAELDINPEKFVNSLGPAQWHYLIGRCDGSRR